MNSPFGCVGSWVVECRCLAVMIHKVSHAFLGVSNLPVVGQWIFLHTGTVSEKNPPHLHCIGLYMVFCNFIVNQMPFLPNVTFYLVLYFYMKINLL